MLAGIVSRRNWLQAGVGVHGRTRRHDAERQRADAPHRIPHCQHQCPDAQGSRIADLRRLQSAGMDTQRRQVVFRGNGDERPLQLALVGKLHGECLRAGGAYHVGIGDDGSVAFPAGIGRCDTPDDARPDAPAAIMHLHHTGVHLCGQVGKPLGKAVQARIDY